MTIKFDKCPRCHGEWKEALNGGLILNCRSCTIEYYKEPMYAAYLFLDLPGVEVCWRTVEHNCVLRFCDPDRVIEMPYLPYDITYDRIKKLMVFS